MERLPSFCLKQRKQRPQGWGAGNTRGHPTVRHLASGTGAVWSKLPLHLTQPLTSSLAAAQREVTGPGKHPSAWRGHLLAQGSDTLAPGGDQTPPVVDSVAAWGEEQEPRGRIQLVGGKAGQRAAQGAWAWRWVPGWRHQAEGLKGQRRGRRARELGVRSHRWPRCCADNFMDRQCHHHPARPACDGDGWRETTSNRI